MQQQFIETGNTKKFWEICLELISPTSLIGPSLAMVTGPAGRGKTEAAKHYAVNSEAIYIPPLNIRSTTMMLREICFEMTGLKPSRSEQCLTHIADGMEKSRRLIIIDEADLLEMRCLEMLRNVNERFACPIILIGEEELKGRVGSRRRLASRIRRRMDFGPINQFDIAHFFKTSLGAKVTSDVTEIIQKHSNGDWRPVLTMAIGLERALKASGISEITVEMVNDVQKNS